MIFAQADLYSNNSYQVTTTSTSGGFWAPFAAIWFIWLLVLIVAIVAQWRTFEKAGQPGWKSLIPIYNFWTLCEIVGKPGWWSLSFLLVVIPFVGWIAPIIVSIIVMLELGKAFNKDVTWTVFLLIIFSLIGMLILGFGDDKFYKSKLSSPEISTAGAEPGGGSKKPTPPSS